MDLQARNCGQGPQVSLLPLGLSWVARTPVEPGSEVTDHVDRVPGEEGFGQFAEVRPSEGSVLEGAVVQIEPVDW